MLRQKTVSLNLVSILCVFLVILTAQAQTFDSGSTGADGALVLTTPGTIVFDPTSFDPPLDPERDNIYHFTSITISEGVTVRLSSDTLGSKPVVWLATGDVVIEGILDLNGEDGHDMGGLLRHATPGAGGFHGGLGLHSPTPGEGPGAGGSNSGAGHVVRGAGPDGGASYGNNYFIPLIGGSGGGGIASTRYGYAGGGAGGGAILIASSSKIAVDGIIQANGGNGGKGNVAYYPPPVGGGGSGGAIRIMTPILEGSGSLSVIGRTGLNESSAGRISLETSDLRYTGDFHGFARTGPILRPVFPAEQIPSVRLTRIAGIDVPPGPTGNFQTVDLTVDAIGEINLDLESMNVPPGTVVRLTLTPEMGERVEFSSTPLEGTRENAMAMAKATLPMGFSRFTVLATWDVTP